MKKIKPLTQAQIDAMTPLEKRRLLVKDILWQIDVGQLNSEDTGYICNIQNEKCTVCAVGAGYVTARKITGKSIVWEESSYKYFEEIESFGFTVSELKQIEAVFECRLYRSDDYRSLQDVLDRLYPVITSEDNENLFDRTKRLRALYQYIWDNEDCKMVPLKGNEE